jgi:hypothetical protein
MVDLLCVIKVAVPLLRISRREFADGELKVGVQQDLADSI